ncbi:hypothetical protein BH10PSE18_BH10PSE18_18670 [soil metagenome]
MSHFITFKGYGVGSSEVTIAVARVTHLHRIDYNGNGGTAIYLDTGKVVNVEEYESDVRRKLEAAAEGM